MLTAVFGDVHGNLEALDAVLRDAKAQGAKAFACLGDVVGYGAEPDACCERVRALGCPVVRGNHDHAASHRIPLAWFNPVAAAAIRWTREHLSPENRVWLRGLPFESAIPGAQLVHGSLDAPPKWHYVISREAAAAHLAKQSARLCFVGHTHVPLVVSRMADRLLGAGLDAFRIPEEDGVKVAVNPGAVGQPRDENPAAAYLLYDPDKAEVVPRRVAYDVEAAARKILAAGLPPFLAARLRVGH